MRSKLFLGMAGAVLLANLAAAQNQRPAAPPQPNQPRPGQGTQNIRFPTTLHQMNDVNKWLKINDEQVNRLNKINEDTQARHRENYAALGTMKESERIARERELNQKYYADFHKEARGVLNDEQWKRYQQYHYQYGGFNAFYEPEIQTQLALTPDQIAALNDQAAWSDAQLLAIDQTGASDATKAQEMYAEYWKNREERINKFLNEKQRLAWRQLTGDPYVFHPTFGSVRK